MWPLLGGLVSGGLNLIGGLMGQQNQANINAQNVAAQEQINSANIANQDAMLGATLANQDQVNAENLSEQERFAQNGIQWRVTDARKAGINPLAALGAQTQSFSNLAGASLPAPVNQTAPTEQANNSFGTGVANMGQDISRAIAATRSPEEQAVAIEKTRQDLEAGQLDNELKRAQIASIITRFHSAQIGPGIPKDGGSNELATYRDQNGQPIVGPSRGTEGWSWLNPVAKDQYFARNIVEPTFGYNVPKSWGPASPGYHQYMNPFTGRPYQMKSWGDMWDTVKGLYGSRSSGSWAWPGEGGSTP